MRNFIRAGLTMLAAGAAAAGCASASTTAPAPAVARGAARVAPAADPRPFGAADTAFGLDVLRAWCAQYPQRNLVFSPSTLATALGMAYLGARGKTAQVMAQVLHLPIRGGDALTAGLQARTAELGRLDGPGVKLAASSQVWADPGLPPLRAYLDAVATSYGAGVNHAPFRTDPRRAAEEINQSIARATRGHITRLVEPGMLANIGWALTSALYMDAKWATPFNPNKTRREPFTPASGHPVTVKYLNGAGFPFATADGWTAVRLPYKGGRLAMTALLPPPGAGACALPSRTAVATITAQLNGTGRGVHLARVSLPRVNLRTGGSAGDMKPALKSLGMGLAFTGRADFTALSPKACCIGFVQQAATLQVGEKGTVASAAAAVGIMPTSEFVGGMRRIVFDRPYLMLITSASTGEPLFLATVANPARR
jgi:serine protease inhibitor